MRTAQSGGGSTSATLQRLWDCARGECAGATAVNIPALRACGPTPNKMGKIVSSQRDLGNLGKSQERCADIQTLVNVCVESLDTTVRASSRLLTKERVHAGA